MKKQDEMAINRRKWLAQTGLLSLATTLGLKRPAWSQTMPESPKPTEAAPLWSVYEHSLKNAKYVDLTHRITPHVPVWHGFGPSRFLPTVDPATGRAYTYDQDGFEATHYNLSTDQLGTRRPKAWLTSTRFPRGVHL